MPLAVVLASFALLSSSSWTCTFNSDTRPTTRPTFPTPGGTMGASTETASADDGCGEVATLIVRVSDRRADVPLLGIPVRAWSESERPRRRGCAPSPTDFEGRASFELAAGSPIRVEVPTRVDGRCTLEVRLVDALAAGESRTLDVQVEPPPTIAIEGKVVRNEDGLALAGAEVLLLSVDEWQGDAPLARCLTDELGRFSMSAPECPAAFGLVRAPRRMLTTFAIEPGHGDPDDPLLLPMPLEARVAVRVVRDDGLPAQDVRVEVELEAWRLSPASLPTAFPGRVCFNATTSSTGDCDIESLPAGTEIDVCAFTRLGMDSHELLDRLDVRAPFDSASVTPDRDWPVSIVLTLPSRDR